MRKKCRGGMWSPPEAGTLMGLAVLTHRKGALCAPSSKPGFQVPSKGMLWHARELQGQ